jgi:hypothetical protein
MEIGWLNSNNNDTAAIEQGESQMKPCAAPGCDGIIPKWKNGRRFATPNPG